MNFEENKVFENVYINEVCDAIFKKVNFVFNDVSSIVVCGSVAKMFSGKLPKEYQAKDLDFVVTNYFVFRYVKNNLAKWFPELKVEYRDRRVILYTKAIVIEFWLNLSEKSKINALTSKINYINYAD